MKIITFLIAIAIVFSGCDSDLTSVKDNPKDKINCSLNIVLGYSTPPVNEVFEGALSFDMDSTNCIIHYETFDIARENVKYINITQ